MTRSTPQSLADLRGNVFAKANAHKDSLIATQENCMQFIIPRDIQVPPNGVTTSLSIVVGADADFEMRKLTASFSVPTNPASPMVNRPTIKVRITDKASGKLLTDGFVDLNLIASPGFEGNPLYFPYKFAHYFRRSQTILIELQNIDSDASGYSAPAQRVRLALDGMKWFKA
jgi:hypothetical protein